ncbi:DUF695 domain-containing protein [Acanthopleuribacter pedis]|uniref:DUF695 domain-containing protein n=1 Tax=Acanthopleuribacter pedis TaxID=442870 RepID=A0A8J7QC24_9BACT|nr:DUF695 domain-containing protein [Acanthopleuribacter pedis]MBO1320959.1 DUF695 domain-containing protein [Acanthopleuribacter pedis]
MLAERYQFIEASKEGLPAHLLVNIALRDRSHASAYPWLLTVSFPFTAPNEWGLCSKEESDRLYDCEDLLLEQLSSDEYCYLGHVSWNGSRDCMLYVGQPDGVLQKITLAMEKIPYKELKVTKTHDPDWSLTLQYFPVDDGQPPSC